MKLLPTPALFHGVIPYFTPWRDLTVTSADDTENIRVADAGSVAIRRISADDSHSWLVPKQPIRVMRIAHDKECLQQYLDIGGFGAGEVFGELSGGVSYGAITCQSPDAAASRLK